MWAVKFWRIYYSLESARMGKDLEHPYNFILTWIGSLCFFTFHLITYALVISKFRFPGWPVSHIWVLLYTFEIITYLAFLLFYRGLIYTVRDIRYGTFDCILYKPISTRFLAFFRNGGAHNLFSAMLGMVFLIGALIYFRLPVSILSLITYFICLGVSLWILHCLSVILISLNFFFGYLPFTQGAIFQIQEIYKYPATLFSSSGFLTKLFIIPLTAVSSLPAALLLLKPLHYSFYLYYFCSAIVLTLLSHIAWSYSLRLYSSSG